MPAPPTNPNAAFRIGIRLLRGLPHLVLALVVTWPVVAHPFTRLAGDPNVDVWNHAWGPWWWAQSLGHGKLPWRTTLLSWPEGGVLWFIDPVLALVGAPLVPLLGTAGAFNSVIVAYVAFASWAARRLALAMGARPRASWVASTALAGSAWTACALHNGITESLDTGWVALALAWGEDAVRAGTSRAWAKAGLGAGLAALASPYLGLATGVALIVRGLPSFRTAWAGGLVACAVGAPPLLALRVQLASPDAIIRHPDAMNEELALHNAVDPRTFFVPFGFRSVDLSSEGFEHSMYLGLVVLALALLALFKRRHGARAWWVASMVCLLLALGPYLYWSHGWVTVGEGQRLRLPWWAFQRLMPGLAATHPLRLAVPALAAVGGLAAVGAETLGRWVPLAVGLVLLDGLIVSGAPWPIATADASIPPVYDALTGPGAVLDLPTDAGSTMATSRYLYWQTAHGHPIPYAPDARASTCALLSRPAFRALAAASPRRADEEKRLNLLHQLNRPQPATELVHNGIRWIVLHDDIAPEATDTLLRILAKDLGPGHKVGHAWWWELPNWRPDER